MAPYFIWLDPEGKKVDKQLGGMDAGKLKARIDDIATKYSTTSTTDTQEKIAWEESLDKATEKSTTTGKLLALVSPHGPTDNYFVKPLSDKKLSQLVKDFVFVKVELDEKSELSKKFKIGRQTGLILIDTLRDKVFRTVNRSDSAGRLSVGNVEEALKAGQPREPKWEENITLPPLLVLHTDDKEESRALISLLSSKMLAALLETVTVVKVKFDPKSVDKEIKKAPALFLVSRQDKKSLVENLTLDGIRKAIKSTFGEHTKWICTNKDCKKVSDEPGECCGKKTELVAIRSDEGTDVVQLEVDGMS